MVNPYFTNLKSIKWPSSRGMVPYDSPEAYEAMYGEQMPWINSGLSEYGTERALGEGVQGVGAGLAHSNPVSDFEVDQFAGFKGSGQGFALGGPIGAIVGGITAQAGQFSKINKNLKNLDTSVDGVSYDAYGRPVYGGSNIVNAQQTAKSLGEGIDKLNKVQLDPAVNLFSSAFGTRRRMKRRRAELINNIRSAQQGYNQAEVNYRNQMNQRSEYLDRLHDRSKLYNLY